MSLLPLYSDPENLERLFELSLDTCDRLFTLVGYIRNESPLCRSHLEKNHLDATVTAAQDAAVEVEEKLTTLMRHHLREALAEQAEDVADAHEHPAKPTKAPAAAAP